MLFIFPCFLKIPVMVFDKQIFARYKPDLFFFFGGGFSISKSTHRIYMKRRAIIFSLLYV